MCGLVGIFDLRRQRAPQRGVIDRMCRSIAHRGPDDAGVFLDAYVGLGFRRLSIIDRVGGRQPMQSDDGSLVLVCNGEIFNSDELARQLREPPRFRTRSDVEVLLYLYREAGADFIERINGQFAFAIYDRARQSLLLARDHFGVCPLFYGVFDGILLFASEIKAILAHPLARRTVDRVGLDQILSFPGLVSPHTLFEGIHSLPSGHRLRAEDGNVVVEEYWDIDYPRSGEPLPAHEDPVERLSELFTRSVEGRLQSEVPLGVNVSGGLDSALIAAVARGLRPRDRLASFSVRFADSRYDESAYQTLIVDEFALSHSSVGFDTAAIARNMSMAVWHGECPVKESYNVCSLALSEIAKRNGVSVVLSGEGADELFGGYLGYRFDQFDRNTSSGDVLEEALEQGANKRMWGDERLFYEKGYATFRDVKRALYSPQLREAFAQVDCTSREIVNHARLRGRHPLHQRSYLDFHLRLADHLVADHGDRMAMANSVEARYPFLDRALVEYVAQLPIDLKFHSAVEKHLLKRVATGRVPAPVIAREKFPFHAPGTPALLREQPEWTCDLLSYDRIQRQGYFDADYVEKLKSIYKTPGFVLRTPYEDDLLMVVLTFSLFLELFEMPSL